MELSCEKTLINFGNGTRSSLVQKFAPPPSHLMITRSAQSAGDAYTSMYISTPVYECAVSAQTTTMIVTHFDTRKHT